MSPPSTTPSSTTTVVEASEIAETVARAVREGGRFAGLLGAARPDAPPVLRAILAFPERFEIYESALATTRRLPALTPLVPAAAWYERELHDLLGIVPVGHPHLDPLVIPSDDRSLRRGEEGERGRAGGATARVGGTGVFSIPYGPVRSGVFESVEYRIETTGEEIHQLAPHVFYKHRGLERRFRELPYEDAPLLAERVEGTCSVAHAVAFARALECLGEVEVPRPAELLRVLHAELERIAVHLDSVIRHTEGAGQAEAFARLSLHKERIQRLRAQLCGHRFGRGVVVPGGVSGPPSADGRRVLDEVRRIQAALADDLDALMSTPSFLDRLHGTGVLAPEVVEAHGALGPVARGSGLAEDSRLARPYGAYRDLDLEPAVLTREGDALARQQVRLFEIGQSFHLVRQALDQLVEGAQGPWQIEVPPSRGLALSWVEAPQGELLYLVEAEPGHLVTVKPRTASFHNLALFPQAFGGDIFTDFVFVEASFGLSIAGVSG